MEEGVALDRVAVPPEMVNVKSLASNAPLPPDVLYNASLNVTAMLALLDATVVPVIVDAVRSTINDVIASVLLTFPAESVTVIVQSEYVPSFKETKVMVLFPEVADVIPDEQEPPYVIVPVSSDENV